MNKITRKRPNYELFYCMYLSINLNRFGIRIFDFDRRKRKKFLKKLHKDMKKEKRKKN